jgi:hypothetical protein
VKDAEKKRFLMNFGIRIKDQDRRIMFVKDYGVKKHLSDLYVHWFLARELIFIG